MFLPDVMAFVWNYLGRDTLATQKECPRHFRSPDLPVQSKAKGDNP
jgi:hypothetical protein